MFVNPKSGMKVKIIEENGTFIDEAIITYFDPYHHELGAKSLRLSPKATIRFKFIPGLIAWEIIFRNLIGEFCYTPPVSSYILEPIY